MEQKEPKRATPQVIEKSPSFDLVRPNGLEPSRLAALPPQGLPPTPNSLKNLTGSHAMFPDGSRSIAGIRNQTCTSNGVGYARQFEIDQGVSDPNYRDLDGPMLLVGAVGVLVVVAVVAVAVALGSLVWSAIS
jgi:hypothetical protein